MNTFDRIKRYPCYTTLLTVPVDLNGKLLLKQTARTWNNVINKNMFVFEWIMWETACAAGHLWVHQELVSFAIPNTTVLCRPAHSPITEWAVWQATYRMIQLVTQHDIFIPDSKVHEDYMGPTWGRQDPGGPHVGPMNLANRDWGRYKMAAISQTTFLNAFSWMKIYEFLLQFHLSLFLRVRLTIFQHWLKIMAWRRPGCKPLSEPMMFSFSDT